MLSKEEAKKFIENTCGKGWLTLVDILYDNCPENIVITEVFQKYSGLEVRFEGRDENFEYLKESLNTVSQKMCEICGQSGEYTIINGWETTLCELHFDESDAKEKYRKED